MAEADVQGKYFYVKSKLNDMVLDVMNSDPSPGALIQTHPQKLDENDNQLFYEDVLHGTIRCKLNDYCVGLNADGNSLSLSPFAPGNPSQQWMITEDKVQNRNEPEKVWDISGSNEDAGAMVCMFQDSDGDNQHWEFEYQPPQFFYIVSAMHGKVVDINKGKDAPGTALIVYSKKSRKEDNQLWYEDRRGFIRSKLHNFLMDSGNDDKFRVEEELPGSGSQEWGFYKGRLANCRNPNRCMDIKKKSKKDGADLLVFDYNGGENQHWIKEFI